MVDVRPAHLTVTRGFPTTTPARTIVDLASVVGPIRLGHAVEDGIVRRLMTFGDIAELLAEVRRRGKPGVAKLVQVLDGIAGEPPPESELERLLWRATEMAGVRAARQRPLPSREPVANLVDVLVPASRLILEADGRRWHARQQAMSNDRRRDREAARLGWQTLRFMFEDLHGDLPGCAADIRQVHRRRTAAAAS